MSSPELDQQAIQDSSGAEC